MEYISWKLGRNITREEWDELVNNDDITDDMLRVIGPEIIKGVAKYIPDMIKSNSNKVECLDMFSQLNVVIKKYHRKIQ